MNNIVNKEILNKHFFNLKYNNILDNNNRYHDKIISLSFYNISYNFYNYIINIYNNIVNKNIVIQIFYKNDRIFYFGLLLILISILIQLLVIICSSGIIF
jgi:hypothetical protein